MKNFLIVFMMITIFSTITSQFNITSAVGGLANTVANAVGNATNINISALKPDQLNIKDIPSLIGSFTNATEVCLVRLRNLMSYMSEGEQLAFYNAYLDLKKDSNSTENSGRCFSPGSLKKAFKDIAKGNMNRIAANLTSNSQKLKGSFACLKKAFDKLGVKADFQQPLNEFVNAQANSNQCLASFIKTLYENLASRRRYLLLNNADINSTATIKDGSISGFSYLQAEVNNITSSFLTFANCYQALPDTLTKSISDVLTTVSQDPKCSSNTTRLLQTPTTSNTTTPAANTTVAANSTASPSTPAPSSTNASSVAPSGSSTRPSGSSPSPSGSAVGPKNPKKSMGKLSLSQIDIAWMNTISTNFNKKTGDYQTIGKLFTDLQSVDLKSKCNLVNQVNSYLNNPGNQIQKLIESEMSKVKKNSACVKTDYLIYIKKDAASAIGSISCNDFDSTCTNNDSLNFKNLENNSFQFAVGCSANTRFGFVHISSTKLGNFFDLMSSGMKTCKTGAAKDCAKQLSNMGPSVKTLKFLQSQTTPSGDSSCVPAMQKTCNDAVFEECKNTNLLSNVAAIAPSPTDSALPDACQDIDPNTPNYTSCFNWINDNLIIYTLFPNMKNMNNIQATIIASQKNTALRELQSSSVNIVASDASSKDTTAQLSPDQYTVSSTDIAIDGASPDNISASVTSSDSIDVAADATLTATPTTPTTNNTNSAFFSRVGSVLLFIAILI